MKVKDYFLTKEEFELKEIQKGILQTVNLPKDLNKYYESDEYLSHSNNKKNLIGNLYAFVQKLNLNYKYKIISKYNKNGKILDYGCGNGVFLNYIQTKNYKGKGYEPNEDAKKSSLKMGLNLIENLNADEKFDVITLWHVLEHIPNPDEILEKLKLLLTEKGKLIIAVPNYKSFDAEYYKEYWAAYDVPRHIFHYSKDGAISFFRQNNFKIENIFPLPFDSYFISMMSAKYKKGLINKIFSPFVGIISNLKAMKTGNYSSLIYVLKK